FSSLLNYRHSPSAGHAQPAETVRAWEGMEVLHGGEERTNYPCTLSVDDLGEGFLLTAQVESSVEPQRLWEMMHTVMERLVEALELEPQRPVHSLDVMPEADKRQVLLEWNVSQTPFPQDKCIHQLFEDQAERTPQAVALIQDKLQLSYAELNARANRLAAFLREMGVGPDTRVALCLERGPEMVLALLAVLKAGGAYVPLDPGYPAQRLGFMLRDSAPRLLLAETGTIPGLAGVADAVPVIDLRADAD